MSINCNQKFHLLPPKTIIVTKSYATNVDNTIENIAKQYNIELIETPLYTKCVDHRDNKIMKRSELDIDIIHYSFSPGLSLLGYWFYHRVSFDEELSFSEFYIEYKENMLKQDRLLTMVELRSNFFDYISIYG